MKKINFLLIPNILIASIAPLCLSCDNHIQPDAEKYASYIFNPTKLNPQYLSLDKFARKLWYYTQEETEAEIIYDLYGFFNLENFMGLKNDDSFQSLYIDDVVGIKTNIGKFSAENKNYEGHFITTFLGYISFVFLQDYVVNDEIIYKKEDYVMITYDLKDFVVNFDYPAASFIYAYEDSLNDPIKKCVGVVKQRINGCEFTYSIESFNTSFFVSDSNFPSNSKNCRIIN